MEIIHPRNLEGNLQTLLNFVQEKLEGVSLFLLSISPFPGRRGYSIAEISLSGERMKPVLRDIQKDAWVLRWILPSDFGNRVLPGIGEDSGKIHLFPLWLTKKIKTWPLPVEFWKEMKNKQNEEICFFSSNSDPNLEDERNCIVPSWWIKALEKWGIFMSAAMKGIAMEDVVRLESSLNGLFCSYKGMQECRAEDRSSAWNGLKLLEETRRVDVDWWGRQQGRLRRPHLSHERSICPFHTPESPRIGLHLHLASGAAWKGDHIEGGDTIFSAAVGLIPYPLHTDGPRLLMGGKNMKQAETGIQSAEPALVPGYLEGDTMDKTTVFPAANRKSRRFFPYLGKNVWTVVMPFDGYTYEDGLVVSESLAEAFSINSYEFGEKLQLQSLKPKSEFRRMGQARFTKLLQETIRAYLAFSSISMRYGDKLPLDFLESFFEDTEGNPFLHRYYFHIPARLSDISVRVLLKRTGTADLELRFFFSADLPLSFGDKITGRHGNKGVVTRILSDKERPIAMIAGREVPIDLIISPCSILGRKNLGQILEMLHGNLLWGREEGIPNLFEVPKESLLTAEEVRDCAIPALKDCLGANGEGLFPVRLSDGRIVRAFVGPQYFMRLHHHCKRKFQARGATGPVDSLTGQPGRGGTRTAQKMGEMEHWSLLSNLGSGENLLTSMRERRAPDDSAGKMQKAFSLALLALGFKLGTEGEGNLSLRRLCAADKHVLETEGYIVKDLSLPEAWQHMQSLLSKEQTEKKISGEILRIYRVTVNQKEEEGDSLSPGDIAEAATGNRSLPFDVGGNLWIPLDLFTGRIDLAGLSGTESPDTGFFRLCDCLKKWSRKEGEIDKAERQYAQRVVNTYTNLLLSFLGGKEGLVRGSMMGRRFSSSGRSVIVPEPSLAPDEVFLPFTQAMEMLAGAQDIIERLRRKQKSRFPKAFPNDSGKVVLSADTGTLDELLSEEPVWCLMIRQPSLHRHSVQAYRVRVWEKTVIGLPPLVTPGFGADFDGDTMAVFLPPEPYAGDLSGFSLLENPGIVGTGEPAFASELDLALGWNALSEEEKKGIFESAGTEFKAGLTLKKAITSIMPFLGTKTYEARREILGTLQKKVCKASTGIGSLSPISFQRLCDGFHSAFPDESWVKKARSEDRKFLEKLESTLKDNSAGAIGLLVNSGAKGGIDDLKAMGAFLGEQNFFHEDEKDAPGTEERSFISANLWEGLKEEELFVYSYSCRDSMASKKLAVTKAGYLSRLLAEGLFETSITADDCGAQSGMLLGFDPGRGQVTVKIPVMENQHWFPSKGDIMQDLLRLAWGRVPMGMRRCLTERDLRSISDAWRGKNSPMEDDLKGHLESRNGLLEIRSPLACQSESPGLCSMCCGADLAGKPYDRAFMVPVGTRVGLTAAQAIGERGTQLSMKRFHQVQGSGGNKAKTDDLMDLLIEGIVPDKNEKENKAGEELSLEERFHTLMDVLLPERDAVKEKRNQKTGCFLDMLKESMTGIENNKTSKTKKKTREDFSLEKRFSALLDILSSEKATGKAEKGLPQALIHFEIALRYEKGLRAEVSSRTEGAFLSALSFEGAGNILRKVAEMEQGSLFDDFSSLKSRLLWR